MKIPKGLKEQDVLDAIENAIKGLAHRFVFGYYDIEDIKQEIRIFCIKALPKFKPGWKLDSFFFINARNRLINLYRDECHRNDPPCTLCHKGLHADPDGHPDKQICHKYAAWLKRNDTKQNILRPVSMSVLEEDKVDIHSYEENEVIDKAEIKSKIDKELSPAFRPDYLRYLAGETIPRARYMLLLAELKSILKVENNYAPD